MKFLDEKENDSPFNNLQRGWVLPYYKTDINSTTWIGKDLILKAESLYIL